MNQPVDFRSENAPPPHGRGRRIFRCCCGRPVFFRNSQCLACGSALGYDPGRGDMLALGPADDEGVLQPLDPTRAGGTASYRRCANFAGPAGCNWLIGTHESAGLRLCRACRLDRTIPDLSDPTNARWWRLAEMSKRRLVAVLIELGLPVRSRVSEDPEWGLAFDFLRSPSGGPKVITGHADGVVTLDIEEADPARRESIRELLQEPYRTVLGHLRHEVGHYYWYRLVEHSAWLEPFRRVFGDERASYVEALRRHYAQGPAADWQLHHVSAYASTHPWEDWAETWAHYLHMLDTLATAASVGVQTDTIEIEYEPFTETSLEDDSAAAGGAQFLAFLNAWIALTGALNELSRSMGHPDYYPFVLSAEAVRKLHFIHRVIDSSAPARRS